MNRYIKLFIGTLTIASLVSCRKYVEDVPIQGQRVLVYTDDYRLLMNNSSAFEIAFGQAPAISCDDLDVTAENLQTRITQNVIQRAMYSWTKPFYVDQNSDYDWNSLYSGIYLFNTVINGVLDSKAGSIETKNVILGEALVHRAFANFMLVNLYAKQYDAATADKDLGIPVRLTTALEGSLARSTVKVTYEQILADIRRAIPLFPNTAPSTKFRPGKAAAYALLTKVYLNMRDFAAAKSFADSTLALSGALYDYNTVAGTTPQTFPSQYSESQVILRKIPRAYLTPYQLSQSLLDLLGTKDLRYVYFARSGTLLNPAFTGVGFWNRQNYAGYPDAPAIGLTVNETWLIKAECLARDGKTNDAVTMLNTLRKLRFRPQDYADVTAANAQEALKLIVDERRREFFGTGLRWFDQRRLNKDALFAQTKKRVFNGTTYTLEPNSNGYVFPMANILIVQNPEIEQNP
ncbi:RagB/SusD family nutrient uptake outer membrane protein [Filimonas effusa]|uniref:RagB/SusD family nutrient uptake outer membrane protein n=1 Tax=Filimonas effusa TaxID=2508721 RepID=A0A4V1MAR5_9BACT|nr:RagB/SusD family nutrient uptake outer membrane protein [Filimonas effusa]RXK86796.1 RagB/SusD family nutrient uptake outer membrane protein [Filimonas effusa]